MMLVPEAWSENPLMDPKRRAFYEYHAALMEPWDGPAAVAFTDGRQIGATLDRNGLRPARFFVTDDDHVVMASEAGVLDVPEERIIRKWRLEPGKMLLVDLERQCIIDDDELKGDLANAKPYQEWLDKTQIKIESLPDEIAPMAPPRAVLLDRQQAFGYTQEDINFVLKPIALSGEDTVGSMGRDTPLAVLSDRPKMLFDYFQQRFAQVTNPPIDSIREAVVMSLVSLVGPRPNLLDLESGGKHIRLELQQADPRQCRSREDPPHRGQYGRDLPHLDDLDLLSRRRRCAGHAQARSMRSAPRPRTRFVVATTSSCCRIARWTPDHVAVPSLLAVAAVHHHLIRGGLRTEVGLVVETGEARQLHDFCLLAGYGAEAINPYVAFGHAVDVPARHRRADCARPKSTSAISRRIAKGILKVMSKMGICTFQSYCGAQIFDAIGLSMPNSSTSISPERRRRSSGIGLDEIAEETVRRHQLAFGDAPNYRDALDPGGEFAFRVNGEAHAWNAETITLLQHAVRGNNYRKFKEYTRIVGEQERALISLRGLLDFDESPPPVPLAEVEPAREIVKRFSTGAMSFGSISWEAHTTLAVAMNRIGGRSNTGEGGEDPQRYQPMANGDSMRSAIKQVASGRFGVNIEYLVNASDLQIKMAQGAKPGEGGQLPGHKVDDWIARTRYSVPGVGLISPPPHHDIYSIEDLAQLIHDLKNANRDARVSVKLVSELGVGTIAAGVCKAYADHVTISSHEGGTGASPLSSIHHAGEPWEVGLAETHQTLVLNGLRGRIAVQVDGGIRSGREVVIGAMLGADEFGFATAALIAEGCIMMRKCHLNTCPVGVATQDPELRRRFNGKPEDVVTFFMFIAEEVRELMAKLGFRTFEDMIGRTDRLKQRQGINHPKARHIDLSRALHRPDVPAGTKMFQSETAGSSPRACAGPQDHPGLHAGDREGRAGHARAADPQRQSHGRRDAVGRDRPALWRRRPARRFDPCELHRHRRPELRRVPGARRNTRARGPGQRLCRQGPVGRPADHLSAAPEQARARRRAIIVGNTVLYGAIVGRMLFQRRRRRALRGAQFRRRSPWSKASAAHGCEYMTGGIVVVLGETGSNFAAGMSGGVAYRAGRGRRVPAALQPGDGRAGADWPTRTRRMRGA